MNKLKKWATSLKNNVYALYLVSIDNRVPKIIKLLIAMIVAYALSPIDLIPDFIPVLGYIDDLILLPLGIWLLIRFVPENVWNECQALAKEQKLEIPQSNLALIAIITTWVIVMTIFILWLWL